MSLMKSFALTSAALLVAAVTYAAPAQTAGTKPTTTKATTGTTSAPKAKSHSVVGTLDKYDSGANSIVVNTGKATETVMLTASSSVHMGASTISASELASHTGQKVKVHYTEANGQRTAQSVQVEAAQAHSSTKPASKK